MCSRSHPQAGTITSLMLLRGLTRLWVAQRGTLVERLSDLTGRHDVPPDACYDRGEPHFDMRFPHFGSLRHVCVPPENRFRDTKTGTPDEKSYDLVRQRESYKATFDLFRRFWVKEPRHSENSSDENCYLSSPAGLLCRGNED